MAQFMLIYILGRQLNSRGLQSAVLDNRLDVTIRMPGRKNQERMSLQLESIRAKAPKASAIAENGKPSTVNFFFP
jgi:hypothetical protein